MTYSNLESVPISLLTLLESIRLQASRNPEAQNQNPWVKGKIWYAVPITNVRWSWLAAHVTFAMLIWLLLLLTAVAQQKSTLRDFSWKSSTLPVLHALCSELRQEIGGMRKIDTMVSEDSQKASRLCYDQREGWCLRRGIGPVGLRDG